MKKKSKIRCYEKAKQLSKRAFYSGIILAIVGIIIFLIQNSEMNSFLVSLLMVSSVLFWWGACFWLFFHCLKGFYEEKLLVVGEWNDFDTIYTGKTAKVLAVIGIIGAGIFILLGFFPVVFIFGV
ncbi:hypothetical protein KKG22_03100 [Patescibacteria group bacterium]|nr:hypothetical protein [Patescibacteria group bacterium]MBU1721365.1 hypothetical protein [Patescibacteria group bacterium]